MREVKKYSEEELIQISDGDQNFVNKMIDLFVVYGSETVEEMITAYEKGDLKSLSVLAHRLKSTIKLLKIIEIEEDVRALEHLGKQNLSDSEIREMTFKIRRIVYEVIEEIKSKK